MNGQRISLCFFISLLFLFACDRPETKTLYVGPHKCETHGVNHSFLGLLAKENPKAVNYGVIKGIRGFDYEWGYNYQVIVNKFTYKPKGIDAPSWHLELVDVVSKEQVKAGSKFKMIMLTDAIKVSKKSKNIYQFYKQKDFYCPPDKLSQLESLLNNERSVEFEFAFPENLSDPLVMISCKK